MLEIAIGMFLFFPLALFLALALAYVKSDLADKAQRRKIKLHEALYRYKPDANGNYPSMFLPGTGQFFNPAPGNRPVPEVFLQGQQTVKQALPPARPLNLNTYGKFQKVQEEEEEDFERSPAMNVENRMPELPAKGVQELPEPEPERAGFESDFELKSEFERPKELEKKRSIAEIEQLLVEYKARGDYKIASILSAAQFKSKTDGRYAAWSAFWDGLPEPESGPVEEQIPVARARSKKKKS
jgi:hypothetical protein